jgi:hypothetical protein
MAKKSGSPPGSNSCRTLGDVSVASIATRQRRARRLIPSALPQIHRHQREAAVQPVRHIASCLPLP